MPNIQIRSVRPFLGSKDFEISCRFYRELGFEEVALEKGFHLFQHEQFGFYLQDAWVKEWLENCQLFVEVESAVSLWKDFSDLDLEEKYSGVKMIPPVTRPWGTEFFLHDPSGILWHFGTFHS